MAGKDFAFIVSAELQFSALCMLMQNSIATSQKKRKKLKESKSLWLETYFMHANVDTNVYSMHYNHAVLWYKLNVWLHKAAALKCMIGNVSVIIELTILTSN